MPWSHHPLLPLMSSAARGAGSAATLALLLLASQIANLSLLRAGRIVGYQHWAFERLSSSPIAWCAVVVLAVQLMVVVRRRSALAGIASLVRTSAARWWIAMVLLAWVVLAAAASQNLTRYAAELVLGTAVQLVAIANLVLLVQALPRGFSERLTAWFHPDSEHGSWRRVAAISIAVVAVSWGLAVVVYDRVPHLPDEIVYLLHARYFAAGSLALPVPAVPGAFDVDLMYHDERRWFSPVPPGWPAILAIGVRVGAPWLVNPLLGGLCIGLLYALVRRIDGERSARLSVVLLAASPWFLFLAMSLMPHLAALSASLAAALGIAEARRRSVAWPAVAAGVAVGLVSLVRPLEGLILAVVLGVWSLGARSRSWRLMPSAALTTATVATAFIVRWYNAALTGSASRFPIMMYNDVYYHPGANDMGFGPNRGMGWGGLDPWPGHGLRDAALNTLLNGSAIQSDLFGWATGSLVAIAAIVLLMRAKRFDCTLLGIAALVAGVHAFYWFSGGPDFGARYWFLTIVPLVVVTARVPALLAGGDTVARIRIVAALLLLVLLNGSVFVGWRAGEKYWHYRRMSGAFQEFLQENALGEALVLVRGRRHPDYHMAALENPLDLEGVGPIFAWDRTREIRQRVVRAYATRPVVIVDGPSVTGAGFRIVAGPLPAGSLAPDLPSSEELPAVMGPGATGMQRPLR